MNVLIVDDQASQRTMLRHLIEDIGSEIKVTDFSDPVNALLWSQKEPPDLVILDYRMPKMDGLEFARRFRRPLSQRDVPIVLVTVVGDEPLRQAALDAGVIDFIVKPVRPRELRSRCKNLLELRQRQQSLKSRAHLLESQLLSGVHGAELRSQELLSRFARAVSIREGRDPLRLERVSRYSGVIAEGLGWDDDRVKQMEFAAALYDIGKLWVPETLLRKPGPLTTDELDQVRHHAMFGEEILRDSPSDGIRLAAEIALGHHERWDGSGYPAGLAGDNIPVSARIVAIADALDAMTMPGPHRQPMPIEQAMAQIRAGAGSQFDPTLVDLMQAAEGDIVLIHQQVAEPRRLAD